MHAYITYITSKNSTIYSFNKIKLSLYYTTKTKLIYYLNLSLF